MNNHSYFLIFISVFCLISLLVLAGCDSPAVVNTQNDSGDESVPSASTSDVKSDVKLTETQTKKIISFQETTFSMDGKSATLKITGANSKDDSVILSVKQGAGENVKQLEENQVTSFGTLRVCVADVVANEETGSAQALVVLTFSQKATAWFSMVTISNVNLTCSVFEQAVESSTESNGAVEFFLEAYDDISESEEFVETAYKDLIAKDLDSLGIKAWEFYVQENGREKFLTLLTESDDFKKHESSIK